VSNLETQYGSEMHFRRPKNSTNPREPSGPTSPCSVLRDEIETELDSILKAWFPRTIDKEYGGFLSDFDYRWRPRGPQDKMLEYQARQTIAAAKGASRSKDLYGTALHGFRYLRGKMWDADRGGWFRLLDRSGNPLEGGTKHGHGSSYAISACVCCYELTAESACLELAKTAFAWLDQHAHDSVHGGYFVFYQRNGCPVLSNDQAAGHGKLRDAIGTPIGYKDANTTSDLLKAFSDLYRVWPDALLKERLQELLRIVRDRLVVAPGLMHMYTHPDWAPLPDFVRYGQVVRSANHLLAAAKIVEGAADPLTSNVAKSMVDMMVRVAWDKQKGGFHLAGSGFGPINLESKTVFVRDKSWWPQADGMRIFLEMASLYPSEQAHYVALGEQLWQYIKDYIRDLRYGGWFAAGLDTNPEARKQPKASIWKDCSHEVEALVDCLSLLA
jgi:mannobiose 2-epimerase